MNKLWILNIYWMMSDYERDVRLLELENNPDGRDVIKLELRECDEWNDKWMINIEYILNDERLWRRDMIDYWDQKTLQMWGMW